MLGELAFGNRLEARDLAVDRLHIEIFKVALAFRRVLLLADMGKAPCQVRHQFGKFLEFLAAAALRHAAETGHALRHISLEADALLFAVIADIDAGRDLLIDDMVHRFVHFRRHFIGVEFFAGFLAHQQIGKLLIARQ